MGKSIMSHRLEGVRCMKLGVVGLPNVGKSTLFNAVTNAGAMAANYPFCTIEPNTGMVPVPDERLERLGVMYHPRKVVPATIEFLDIAGLVRGASRGEGLGNKFLSHIREVDAVVHVVRCFADDNIVHVEGSVDPLRDMETVNLELIFADMDAVQRRMDRAQKLIKTGEKKYQVETELAARVLQHLEKGLPARAFSTNGEEEAGLLRGWFLLTTKPVIYALNISENDIGKPEEQLQHVPAIKEAAAREGAETLTISAAIEQEVAAMEPSEREVFLRELGIGKSGLDRLVQRCYSLLGLISFFTVGDDECRAWTVTQGTKAPQAAGKIHTDFERGFIRAEVVPFPTLEKLGSRAACRDKGLMRSEGKDYVIQDGDVVLFRFNV